MCMWVQVPQEAREGDRFPKALVASSWKLHDVVWEIEFQSSGRVEKPTNRRDHYLESKFNDFKPGNNFILESRQIILVLKSWYFVRPHNPGKDIGWHCYCSQVFGSGLIVYLFFSNRVNIILLWHFAFPFWKKSAILSSVASCAWTQLSCSEEMFAILKWKTYFQSLLYL